jgi:hypothetical protein
VRLCPADQWLAGHLDRGQRGDRILAHLVRDQDTPCPVWWLEAITLPSGQPYQALSAEGRVHLARLADWTAHSRTWGARLVQDWIGAWREHQYMWAYSQEFPKSAMCTHQPPPSPPVTTWADQAAKHLWDCQGDHAAALDAYRASLDLGELGRLEPDRRIYGSLVLAPLRYGEALSIWCGWARGDDAWPSM